MTDIQPDQPTSAVQSSLTVKVYAPFHVYYEGPAKSVSAVNEVGPFDILPKHRKFLCMLVPCQLKVTTHDDQVKSIRVNRALMHVTADRVVVFMDV